MRITLAIDDDVLNTAKALAAQQQRTVGEIISDLARRAKPCPSIDGLTIAPPLTPGRQLTVAVELLFATFGHATVIGCKRKNI